MPKKSLRKLMLDRRRALSAADRRRNSRLIQEKLISRAEYADAHVVALYSPIHNEVEMEGVVDHALSSGKTVLLPAVSRTGGLLFRELTQTSCMHEGKYGILEPCVSNRVYDPAEADIIVVPGIAFDMKGHRIGYGKGYYDKTLHHLEGQGRIIAVCYDFQLVDVIAGEPHDVKIDLVITEKRIVSASGTV
jgi:5-formyltetrahydrofolate cyclo-ligase